MSRFPCLFVVLLMVGCAREYSHYQRGMELVEEDPAAAQAEFLMAIAKKDHTAEAHYQAAILCGNAPENAVQLVWHLQSYLALSPQADQNVKQWLLNARNACLATLSTESVVDLKTQDIQLRLRLLEEHALRQKQWLTDLRRENEELRRHLGDMRQEQ